VTPFTTELSSPVWQQRARGLVAANNQNAQAASRVYAALSIAQYRAVQAVDGKKASDDELADHGLGKGGRSRFEARRGAVAGASVRVLSFLFPAAAATLEGYVDAEGSAGPGREHPSFTRGEAAGRAAGDAMVAHLMTDGFTAPFTGTIPVGSGYWTPNGPPAGANLPGVRPHFLNTTSQFRPAPPPAFGSPAFLAGLNEVLAVSQTRTAQQIAIANFWNHPAGTYTPPGYWNEKAAIYIQQAGLDERAATHVFALAMGAQFDAVLGCWDAKYTYYLIRPAQANPAITLVFPTPNHPSYPSGHSCVSSSSARVLARFFPKRTAELEALVNEAGVSRLYAGIHYTFDMVAGKALGYAVADWAIARDRSNP
jgi:membrane-associated phospholipid phosphatase